MVMLGLREHGRGSSSVAVWGAAGLSLGPLLQSRRGPREQSKSNLEGLALRDCLVGTLFFLPLCPLPLGAVSA